MKMENQTSKIKPAERLASVFDFLTQLNGCIIHQTHVFPPNQKS